MKLYIKWYYGYKNFGDELLLIWLVNYFAKVYSPTHIYIESADKKFLTDRISKNQEYFEIPLNKITITTKLEYIYKYPLYIWCHKIIWGGECISPVAKFPNWWRKYLIWFWRDLLSKNYTICWGIGTPSESNKKLYKILLGRAKSIVVRDPESQKISLIYNPKTVLYHDFAIDVIDKYTAEKAKKIKGEKAKVNNKYVLLNLKKSEYNDENLKLIKEFVSKYPDHKIIYIANFIWEDDGLIYSLFTDLNRDIELYDWTYRKLDKTFRLFDNCEAGWWVRLHFLMILKTLWKDYEYIYYQEKIRKLIW